MGQCGCGDIFITQAHPVAGTDAILAVDEYHGCQDCATPLALRLLLFTPAGWEEWRHWGNAELGEPMVADDCGGNRGYGWNVELIGRNALVQAAQEDEELAEVCPEDYATLADLMADWGLRLLQVAMRKREAAPRGAPGGEE